MPIELIDKIKQKNNGQFALVDATDVELGDGTRLQEFIDNGDFVGQQGPQGPKGEDGISATHYWDGTTLTIASASGISSANLKGEKGDKPVKGTDYFTDGDKQEFITTLTPTIENMINQAIGEIENGTY